jgi:hypothetical protein
VKCVPLAIVALFDLSSDEHVALTVRASLMTGKDACLAFSEVIHVAHATPRINENADG